MNTEIFKTIDSYEEKGDFTHAVVTDEMLSTSEKKLGVILPEDYKNFIFKYGHGGIGGMETFGFGKNGTAIFERETIKYREYGLPNNLIVIENCDEWLYCLDSESGRVVMWSRGDKEPRDAYDCFESYLAEQVNDAIDNL